MNCCNLRERDLVLKKQTGWEDAMLVTMSGRRKILTTAKRGVITNAESPTTPTRQIRRKGMENSNSKK